jgi:hypothetical protein
MHPLNLNCFDLTLFHKSGQDVAEAFVNEERERRRAG